VTRGPSGGLALLLALASIGCEGGRSPGLGDLLGSANPPAYAQRAATSRSSADGRLQRRQFMQDVQNNPDTPAWHEQREKLALAMGDRVFDRTFDRVFDSMAVAVASLGARVQNMERQSGYIAAAAPTLAPDRQRALTHEGLVEYGRMRGYDPAILDRADGVDVEGTGEMMARFQRGMTISMVRQGPAQTKVKLRVDSVYYPRTVEEYYKVVWNAVDKQMFLDRALG
jgi:hypothetical protein